MALCLFLSTGLAAGARASERNENIEAAVSEDAVRANIADFVFSLKSPIDPATVPPGSHVTVSGIYDSYTADPISIRVGDAAVQVHN